VATCDGHHDFIQTPFWAHVNLIKSTFIWIQTHVHIFFEVSAIVELQERPFLFTVLRHLILARWAVYQVGPNRAVS
jgi:hypothetical protein